MKKLDFTKFGFAPKQEAPKHPKSDEQTAFTSVEGKWLVVQPSPYNCGSPKPLQAFPFIGEGEIDLKKSVVLESSLEEGVHLATLKEKGGKFFVGETFPLEHKNEEKFGIQVEALDPRLPRRISAHYADGKTLSQVHRDKDKHRNLLMVESFYNAWVKTVEKFSTVQEEIVLNKKLLQVIVDHFWNNFFPLFANGEETVKFNGLVVKVLSWGEKIKLGFSFDKTHPEWWVWEGLSKRQEISGLSPLVKKEDLSWLSCQSRPNDDWKHDSRFGDRWRSVGDMESE